MADETAAVVAPDPEVEKLKADLDATKKSSASALALVDEARTKLSNELEKLKTEKAALEVDLKKKIEVAEAKVLALESELKKKATGVVDALKKDCVVLEGKVYDIIHKNRVWEFVHGARKSVVDENHTAVVIAKPG